MSTLSTLELPIVNLLVYLQNPLSKEAKAECIKAAQAMQTFSAFAVRDHRVSEADNSAFIDLQESYFSQPLADKMADVRADLHYQVGPTPGLKEMPKCGGDEGCLEFVANLAKDSKPLSFSGYDPKWRFFWRIGTPPKESKFAQLNAEPVIPAAFPQWQGKMDRWGSGLLDSVHTLSEMLAIGFDLPSDTFSKLLKDGPHLLAPTASDLDLYGKEVGQVLAGFHYDLNFITIHGKSRYPGLNIWTRDGKKMAAKIPDGCLLIQEYLTAGQITAGYHEVVVTEATLEAVERQKANGRPNWRISSTLFSHVASDNTLEPIGKFAEREGAAENYPAMLTGDHVNNELKNIKLFDEKEQ